MKTIDRYLCGKCAQQLRTAEMRYMKVPNWEQDEKTECDWCHRTCVIGSTYRIAYGGKR